MTHQAEIAVKTKERTHWLDITSQVQAVITKSGISNGLCTLNSLHTTAGLTVNENADSSVGQDVYKKLNELIPQQDNYSHAEGNADAHIKTSLVGASLQVPIKDGQLVFGTWQGIYFCEFDGPRSRKVFVTIIGE